MRLIVSGAVLNTVLQKGLRHRFSSAFISKILSSVVSLPDSDLSEKDIELISGVYMQGLHCIFISYAILATILFLVTLGVHDYGLSGKSEKCKQKAVTIVAVIE